MESSHDRCPGIAICYDARAETRRQYNSPENGDFYGYQNQEFREKQAKEGRKHWSESVPEEYHEFPEVFEKRRSNELPQRRSWTMQLILLRRRHIEIEFQSLPIVTKRNRGMNAFINENLATGRIVPSKSLIASPFFFVKRRRVI